MTTTAPTTAPPARTRSRDWRGDVQGLRAIAVLLVVTFHAGLPVPGGFVGVDVFFVISGFVITALLMRELQSTGRLSFATFYTRRVRRLLPALGLMVSVTLIGSLLLQSPYGVIYNPQEVTAKTGIGAMLIVANAVLYATGGGYFALDADTNPLLHTWSLSVEEQFYLIFPLLVLVGWWLGRRRHRSRRTALLLVAILGFGSFALSYVMSYGSKSLPGISDPAGFAFFSSFTRAWEFAAGAALALVSARIAKAASRSALPLAVVGGVLITVGAFALSESRPFPGLVALIPVVGAGLVLAAGTVSTDNVVSRGLAAPVMVWIGDRSYSWYLWHWPIIVFSALLWPGRPWVLVVAAAVSIIPAWLSYRYFENPIRHSPALRSGRRVSALAVVVIVIPCLLGAALLASSRSLAFGRLLPKPVAAWDVQECTAQAHASDVPTICRYPSPDGEGSTVMLVGDSHAASLTDAFLQAAGASGFDATTSTFDGCNYAKAVESVRLDTSSRPIVRPCAGYYALTDQWLADKPQALVVISNRSPFYAASGVGLYDELVRNEQPCLESVGRCVVGDEAISVWTDALTAEVKRLTEAGSKVLVVATVPEHLTDAPAESSLLRGVRAPGTDRSLVESRRDALVAAERKAIEQIPGATYVDPLSDLCGDATCWQERDGKFLYIDDDHLSVDGGRLVEARLQKAMQEALA